MYIINNLLKDIKMPKNNENPEIEAAIEHLGSLLQKNESSNKHYKKAWILLVLLARRIDKATTLSFDTVNCSKPL